MVQSNKNPRREGNAPNSAPAASKRALTSKERKWDAVLKDSPYYQPPNHTFGSEKRGPVQSPSQSLSPFPTPFPRPPPARGAKGVTSPSSASIVRLDSFASLQPQSSAILDRQSKLHEIIRKSLAGGGVDQQRSVLSLVGVVDESALTATSPKQHQRSATTPRAQAAAEAGSGKKKKKKTKSAKV